MGRTRRATATNAPSLGSNSTGAMLMLSVNSGARPSPRKCLMPRCSLDVTQSPKQLSHKWWSVCWPVLPGSIMLSNNDEGRSHGGDKRHYDIDPFVGVEVV